MMMDFKFCLAVFGLMMMAGLGCCGAPGQPESDDTSGEISVKDLERELAQMDEVKKEAISKPETTTESKMKAIDSAMENSALELDAIKVVINIADSINLPPSVVDRTSLMLMMRKAASQMARKAIKLGIAQPETAKNHEDEFKRFLRQTMHDGPNMQGLTLLASVMHSEQEVRYLRQKLKFASFERDLGLFLLRHRHILPDSKFAHMLPTRPARSPKSLQPIAP